MRPGPAQDERLNRAIGVRIERERKRQRLTLQVLADRAGVHFNTVDNAESGRSISLLGLCRIAAALDVGLDALVPLSQIAASFVSYTCQTRKNT